MGPNRQPLQRPLSGRQLHRPSTDDDDGGRGIGMLMGLARRGHCQCWDCIQGLWPPHLCIEADMKVYPAGNGPFCHGAQRLPGKITASVAAAPHSGPRVASAAAGPHA